VDLDLIVARESFHKGQGLMANAIINNLVDERHRKVFLGTSMIEIVKFGADANGALFFVNKDGVGDP
jgi:hypothetical protein